MVQGTDSETGGIATTTGEQMMVGMESSAEECECFCLLEQRVRDCMINYNDP